MFESLLSYVGQTLLATFFQILILLGPGILLAVILHFITVFMQRRAIGIIGQGWYLGLFGWLGTVIHELGHTVFCVIFWHKITDIQLFHPDPETGTLGYVEHAYNANNVYQRVGNFFIGIGPILLGAVVIYLLSYFLLGLNPSNLTENISFTAAQLSSWDTLKQLCQNIGISSGNLLAELFSWQQLTGWQFYVFIYLAFTIGNAITLSPPDIKSAFSGFMVMTALIWLFNLVTFWAGDIASNMVIKVAVYCMLLYALMILIILLDILAAWLLIIPQLLKGTKPVKTS